MIDIKNKSLIKKITYSVLSNVVSISVSVLLIVLLPKVLDVVDYSYWQLYVFYTSYLGLLHFGWIDGIYLRYAGFRLEELDKTTFSSQIVALTIFEFTLSILAYNIADKFVDDPTKLFVIKGCCFALVPSILYWLNCFILQITNKIEDYARINVLERILLLTFIIIIFSCFDANCLYLIGSDILTKFFVCLISLWHIRLILVNRFSSLINILDEAWANISVGIKLLFSNIAGLLIIGIVRFAISYKWDIITFGKVSLMLSISNFIMVFINALGIVLFPILKSMPDNKLVVVYDNIRNLITLILAFGLFAYYPIKELLIWWLPKYADSVYYMTLLFPIIFFESRVVLLINTYYKSLRLEKEMLIYNSIMVACSVIFTFFSVFIFENLNLAVLLITVLFGLKNFISEIYLQRFLKVNFLNHWMGELSLVSLFILINLFIESTFLQFLILTFGTIIFIIHRIKKLKKSVAFFIE